MTWLEDAFEQYKDDPVFLKETIAIMQGELDQLRAEVERLKLSSLALECADLQAENAKLRTVEEAAKLLKTDPNNDAYRFNLWQTFKDKE